MCSYQYLITDQLDHSFRFSNVSIKMLTVQDFLLKFSTEKTKKKASNPTCNSRHNIPVYCKRVYSKCPNKGYSSLHTT